MYQFRLWTIDGEYFQGYSFNESLSEVTEGINNYYDNELSKIEITAVENFSDGILFIPNEMSIKKIADYNLN